MLGRATAAEHRFGAVAEGFPAINPILLDFKERGVFLIGNSRPILVIYTALSERAQEEK